MSWPLAGDGLGSQLARFTFRTSPAAILPAPAITTCKARLSSWCCETAQHKENKLKYTGVAKMIYYKKNTRKCDLMSLKSCYLREGLFLPRANLRTRARGNVWARWGASWFNFPQDPERKISSLQECSAQYAVFMEANQSVYCGTQWPRRISRAVQDLSPHSPFRIPHDFREMSASGGRDASLTRPTRAL